MSQDPNQKYLNSGLNFTTERHDTYPYISPSNSNLSGKHVLITGASKGIGLATALSYACAGASGIAVAARSPLEHVVEAIKAAAKSSGCAEPMVVAVAMDVTDRLSVDAGINTISAAFNGRLDVLINNAGNLSPWEYIPDSDPDAWWRDWEVNVKGTYLVTRACWPLLLKSELKIVLNVTSVAALYPTPKGSAYAGSKLAMIRFNEFIHQDHGPGGGKDGVLAISVHPGTMETDLSLGLPEEWHSYLVDTPELAGDTLCWLGAERREWLGGRYVSANWDLEEFVERREEVEKGDLLRLRLAVNSFGA